jgi:hypothetical protein
VWVMPYFSGHSWWWLVIGGGRLLLGEPQRTARVLHTPPQLAVVFFFDAGSVGFFGCLFILLYLCVS